MAELSPLFPIPLLILIFSILIWLKLAKRNNNLRLPPSPPKLPIIGNIHQLGKLPHRSLRDLSSKYGPLLLLRLGHNPTLLVSSADIVKEIVKNHDAVFSNRPKTTAADILLYGCKDLGFAPYGEYWKQVKKISVLELFSHKRVQSFQFVRDEEVGVIIDKIRGACRKGESINLSEMLVFVSNNIVSRCVIGRKTEEDDGTCSKFGLLAKRLMVLLTSFCAGDMFPYLRWLDMLTGLVPNLKALSGELDAYLDQIIEEHEASKSNNGGAAAANKKDFVSIIFQLQKDGMLDMDLTQDNIKAILLDMFLAGTDTTASTAEWLMAELLKHPEAMKKLQQEVRDVVGKKSKVETEDIGKMNYLKCVLKETLRLHPVAPLLLPRQTSASVELGGYDVPSNTTVLINAWAIQRDPEWWENPEEFMPERFENSGVDLKGEDFRFIPFGLGRRSCPGLSFGVASIEYMVANLVYCFDWKLADGGIPENLDMSEVYGIAVNRKTPLHVLPVSQRDCVKNES
ncbi:cytochrome P450, family 71, subfamily A, polypeptide 22 [Hibiscus trionum]|uniref:Cytochrome P450, family 71, subfamily A, polypeptide 22 n=1 Tax=Hibiscus trionum TaxID=183268 RepID=A0A9W7GZ66_HIBTR|nr:cytochrome P450, family 71, subfamily A, polypeptide 22 [Hibiscus trionum]